MAEPIESLPPDGAIAVIFVAQRTGEDDEGYGRTVAQIAQLVVRQPGYLGMDAAESVEGLEITVSYWADQVSALAWKAQADHAIARDMGRARWYDFYRLIVTRVERSYDWQRSR